MRQNPEQSTAPGIPAERIRRHLQDVLSSAPFAGSERLRSLLQYVVEQTLSGDGARLKEYTIGVDVFHRGADYNPQVDSTVRVHAAKLREKLREYYLTEGREAALQIELLRGSYAPVFHDSEPVSATAPVTPVSSPARARRVGLWAVGGVVVALALLIGVVIGIRVKNTLLPAGGAVSFMVPPPEGLEFAAGTQVSPDGRRIASGLRDLKDGTTAIYLHNLESGMWSIVPGTKGGTFPYWSYDSKALLFGLGNDVVRLDLAGGAQPSTVVRGTTWPGVDSNKGGVVLLVSASGRIARTSLSARGGGAPSPMRVPDGVTGQLFPRFLPDGEHFLYLGSGKEPPGHAIFVASFDGSSNLRIMGSDSKAAIVPAADNPRFAYLLFVRASNLMAQRFDLVRRELTADLQKLAEGVPVWPYGQAPFSASRNGVLVYTTAMGPPAQLTWYNRSGVAAGTTGPLGDITSPVLSPDGTRVAYDIADGPNRDVWVTEIATGKAVRITFDPQVDHGAVWSPDGRIAFESHRDPPGLYVASSGGGAESPLVPGGDSLSDWTSDGKFVLFGSMRNVAGPEKLWLFPLAGSEKPYAGWAPDGNETGHAISRDGKWIAYVSDKSGRNEVYVRSFQSAGPAGPSDKWQVSTAGGVQPCWRMDSAELFYLSPDNHLMAVGVRTGPTFDYSKPAELFQIPTRELRGPRNDYTTRDGKRFLVRVPARASPAPPLHVVVNWQDGKNPGL